MLANRAATPNTKVARIRRQKSLYKRCIDSFCFSLCLALIEMVLLMMFVQVISNLLLTPKRRSLSNRLYTSIHISCVTLLCLHIENESSQCCHLQYKLSSISYLVFINFLLYFSLIYSKIIRDNVIPC